jgi:SAM-dependent methyltransferase
MTESFKDMERNGWERNAAAYDGFIGGITRQIMGRLVDAAGVGAGKRVLEIACGTGDGSVAAAGRGADTVGIDFAPSMIAEAKKRNPNLEFRSGDAEDLAFEDASFDAVICPFGILHFEQPERMAAEAYRVLRPGGKFAFTAWASLAKSPYIKLVVESILAHGTMDVGLPPAPDFFRFSDHAECRDLLTGASFVSPAVQEHVLSWPFDGPDALVDLQKESGVRMRLIIERQSREQQENIYQAMRDGAPAFAKGDAYEAPWPAVLASARKT